MDEKEWRMADPHHAPVLRAAIFDLDGVITLTASLHAWAWKTMFDVFLEAHAAGTATRQEPFDDGADFRDYVNGRPRIEGVREFLASRRIELPLGTPDAAPSHDTMWGLGNLKQVAFLRGLEERDIEVDEQTVSFIRRLRTAGVATAVASSSKNCARILERVGLTELFEARVDGVVSEEIGLPGKPAPDIFLEAAARLGVPPRAALVVEDALAGVEAGRAGRFGLVIGMDREGHRAALREHGADLVIERFDPALDAAIRAWFESAGQRIPSLLHEWDAFVSRLAGRRPALFLDYDGTLTPIVSRPELAVLPPEGRDVLHRVADAFPVAIISGRGREDVERLAGLPGVAYAGSHGFDLSLPRGERSDFRPADWIVPRMTEVRQHLEHEVGAVPGVLIEDKGYSVAVHYRLADPSALPVIRRSVDSIAGRDERLRFTPGKMVFDIRPNLPWDKGRALTHLLDALDLNRDEFVPIYIGDDTTDEDAFAVLAVLAGGVGILVSEAPRATKARYRVQAPWEVWAVLDRLLMEYGTGNA